MLQTLKRYNKQSNLFYGINSGNYGFLMKKDMQECFIILDTEKFRF